MLNNVRLSGWDIMGRTLEFLLRETTVAGEIKQRTFPTNQFVLAVAWYWTTESEAAESLWIQPLKRALVYMISSVCKFQMDINSYLVINGDILNLFLSVINKLSISSILIRVMSYFYAWLKRNGPDFVISLCHPGLHLIICYIQNAITI